MFPSNLGLERRQHSDHLLASGVVEVMEVEEDCDSQLEVFADAWLVADLQTVIQACAVVAVVMYPVERISEI